MKKSINENFSLFWEEDACQFFLSLFLKACVTFKGTDFAFHMIALRLCNGKWSASSAPPHLQHTGLKSHWGSHKGNMGTLLILAVGEQFLPPTAGSHCTWMMKPGSGVVLFLHSFRFLGPLPFTTSGKQTSDLKNEHEGRAGRMLEASSEGFLLASLLSAVLSAWAGHREDRCERNTVDFAQGERRPLNRDQQPDLVVSHHDRGRCERQIWADPGLFLQTAESEGVVLPPLGQAINNI